MSVYGDNREATHTDPIPYRSPARTRQFAAAATGTSAPDFESAPVAAASSTAVPAAEGDTPWSEEEAKREERRRKALERKAQRAAKRGQ